MKSSGVCYLMDAQLDLMAASNKVLTSVYNIKRGYKLLINELI